MKGIFSPFGMTLREGPDAGLSAFDEQIQGLRPISFCGLGLGLGLGWGGRGVKNSSKAFSAEGSGPFGDGEGQSVGRRGHFGVCTCRRQEEGGQFSGSGGRRSGVKHPQDAEKRGESGVEGRRMLAPAALAHRPFLLLGGYWRGGGLHEAR